MTSEPARLPFLSILVFWLNTSKNFGLLGFFLLFQLINKDTSLWIFKAAVVGYFLFCLFVALWSYRSFTYQIDATSITVNKGIFQKKQTILPFERMQTIKANHLFYLRPFKLARLTIESAASSAGEAEIVFPVLSLSVIRSIETAKASATEMPTTADQPIHNELADDAALANLPLDLAHSHTFTLRLGEIFLFSLTDFSIFAIFFALVFQLIDKLPNLFSLTNELAKFGLLLGGLILTGGLLLFMLVSLAINVFRYYGFQVSQIGNQLQITQGLFSKQQQTIPLSKIQGVRVEQNIYRRLFRLRSVKLLLATGSSTEGENKVYLFPIIKEPLLIESLQRFLPEWTFQQPDLVTDPTPTLWYFYRWPFLLGLVSSGIAAYFFWWAAVLLVLVFGSFMISGLWRGKIQGYQCLSDQVLLCQSVHGLTKVTAYLTKNKIQDFTITTTYWQYRKSLGQLRFTVKTGDTITESELFYFPLADATRLKLWYLS